MGIEEKIKNLLAVEKPGWEAQKKMSPVIAGEAYRELPEKYLKASVVLLMYPEQGATKSIFIQRSQHPKDKHSGQISLPGGKLEGSEDFLQAAKREVYEEIGVHESKFEIIGELSPLYVFVSKFLVQPFVAWTYEKPKLILQQEEVSKVLHVDLDVFMKEGYRKKKDLKIRQSVLRGVPYFDLDGSVLWGATAMIMSEFSEIIKDPSLV